MKKNVITIIEKCTIKDCCLNYLGEHFTGNGITISFLNDDIMIKYHVNGLGTEWLPQWCNLPWCLKGCNEEDKKHFHIKANSNDYIVCRRDDCISIEYNPNWIDC